MKKAAITDKIITKAKELASIGLNNKQIAQALSLSVFTLSRNRQLRQAIQEGKQILAEQVTKSILDNLDDTQNRLFVAKRLNLFNPQINIKKPTTAKEALENLSEAIKQYADGEINESQLRTIEAVSNSFVRGCEIVELEKRLEVIENEFNKTKA